MVDTQTIQQLREQTGCGMLDCKKALEEAGGVVIQAIEILRKKGEKLAASKSERSAKDGAIASYIHPGARVGVLLKLQCETDFVARSDDFQALAHELCLQIAAMSPRYVKRTDVPTEIIAKEREIAIEQLASENKPATIVEKIVDGKIEKYYSDVCLVDQAYIKDDKRKVADIVRDVISKVGENIQIAEFTRYSL